jgi:hypothetical protein
MRRIFYILPEIAFAPTIAGENPAYRLRLAEGKSWGVASGGGFPSSGLWSEDLADELKILQVSEVVEVIFAGPVVLLGEPGWKLGVESIEQGQILGQRIEAAELAGPDRDQEQHEPRAVSRGHVANL